METQTGTILVVDDNGLNRMLICTNLQEQGFVVEEATNGQEAMDMLGARAFDVILLDLVMPVMDGFEVLRRIKEDPALRHLPVIVISSIDEMDSVIRCIEMGATDHLPKPFDPVLLKARLNASLVSKRMHDLESAYLDQIRAEQQKSEQLLLNVLPAPIAEQLKQGKTTIVDHFPDVTVMFADLAGFTPFAAKHSPSVTLDLLNTVFLAFDQLADHFGMEKIKTIGDAYMVAGGLPIPCQGHLEAAADMALALQQEIARLVRNQEILPIKIHIGIHVGAVMAGVIGRRKFAYDLWGDTVNVASRLNEHASGGSTLVSEEVYQRLKDRYRLEGSGTVRLKGLREMKAYLLQGKR